MSYYSEGRRDEAIYVRIGKDWDYDEVKTQILEELDGDEDYTESQLDKWIWYRISDEDQWAYDDLKQAIVDSAPKSMYETNRNYSWMSDNEIIVVQNPMFEIRLVDEQDAYVVVFALRSDYEPWYTYEQQIRNLAIGNLQRTAKGFFYRLHENSGYNMTGNLLGFDFVYVDGVSQYRRDKKGVTTNGTTTIKVGNVPITFSGDKWTAPVIG